MKGYFLTGLLCAFLFNMNFSQAGFQNQGRTGLAFLKVGVGARATGMGEAYTAVANDAYASYWNPAGLVAASSSNAVLMHNEWLLDVAGEFLAVQFKAKRSAVGLHFYSFSVGNINIRNIPSESPLEVANSNYISAGLSYARQVSDDISVGLTLKYLFEKFYVFSASGAAVDFGFRVRMPNPNFFMAGVIQNVGKMSRFQNESTRLPIISKLGAMYAFPNPVGPFQVLLGLDLVKPVKENMRFHLGTEFVLWRQFALRMGYLEGYENRNMSFGVGVLKSWFHVDYSFTPFNENFENAHRFSFYLAL